MADETARAGAAHSEDAVAAAAHEATAAATNDGSAADAAAASLTPAQALERVRAILTQLEELEPRLGAASSGEVEMTLLERATELVEEAGRLLERLGRLTA